MKTSLNTTVWLKCLAQKDLLSKLQSCKLYLFALDKTLTPKFLHRFRPFFSLLVFSSTQRWNIIGPVTTNLPIGQKCARACSLANGKLYNKSKHRLVKVRRMTNRKLQRFCRAKISRGRKLARIIGVKLVLWFWFFSF